MVSLSVSSSRSSYLSSSSLTSLGYVTVPPSPAASSSSDHSAYSSSSEISLDPHEEENATITSSSRRHSRKQRSQEDLRLLAVSTHMTELSYTISDIQTRIFEIQELRHKSQSSGDTASTTSIIDQSLMNLDERIESVVKGMKSVNESLESLSRDTSSTPTPSQNGDTSETKLLLRKHAALVTEWESVQDESEVLREELKEDKWLTVFRTVTDQADGMMSSLEKAVNRCQEFIWQVHRRGADNPHAHAQSLSSPQRDKPQLTFEVFTSLLDSFEAKKKHYMPATSKVLSIIDKGVHDRVTKNGETLRRHAESAQRWRNLRERITRTDKEMENVRKILLSGEVSPSEAGSSTSGTAVSMKNGYLATPPGVIRMSRSPSSSTISRSLTRFAKKLTGTTHTPPITPIVAAKMTRMPSSDPQPTRTLRRQRTSLFESFRGAQQHEPSSPDRPGHKYSQSLTPESSPRALKTDMTSTATVKGRPNNKERWNSSTKVERDERTLTVKGTPPRRAPSATGMYAQHDDIPPVPQTGTPHRRSLSRVSMASSRPWSPITSSGSTAQSSTFHHPSSSFRPPSRAQTPSHGLMPGAGVGATPRPRPKTPSHIPAPSKHFHNMSRGPSESGEDDSPRLRRTFSPSLSVSATSNASSSLVHPPRPPSRSMIPVPSLHLSSPSRPSSSFSNYSRSESPMTTSFRSSATRAQTPESALRARVQHLPFYHGTMGRTAVRPALGKLPPSSFKDSPTSRAPSRPGSRAGAYTPSMDQLPMYEYVAGNPKDPLDVEVALVVNSVAHGLLVERVDPPLRKIPKDGEEIKAAYAFSNTLSRKVVTCRLTTLTRTGKTSGDMTTKKVMCRVGGGWQDLSHYMLNRQAGM